MTVIEIIKYISFGYSLLVVIVAFALADGLSESFFYRKFYIAGIISFGFGVLFELTNFFSLEKGLTILVMSVSIIYLIYFELFRRLFKLWKGVNPYIPSKIDGLGDEIIEEPINGTPKVRTIMWTDYLFGILQAVVPVVTIAGLFMLIVNR